MNASASPTEILCRRDPRCLAAEVEVLSCRGDADGHHLVVTDRTPFHPSGGGQPHDVGFLGSARVLDVALDGDVVIHRTDAAVAGRLTATVDEARRSDHSQQHTGQHLLSALLHSRSGAATVAFHLGRDLSTIDLDREVAPRDLEAVEDEAAAIVARALPIGIREHEPAAARDLPLRKDFDPAALHGASVRVIEIPGVDLQACCGTHCGTTAEIGALRIVASERKKGAVRLHFAAGQRVLALDRRRGGALRRIGELLSVGEGDAADAVERILDRERAARRLAEDRLEALLDIEARALAATGETAIVRLFDDRALEEIQGLARRLAAEPGRTALLGARQGAESRFVFARSADVVADMGGLLRRVATEVGIRGGGRPDHATGGGRIADPAAALELARRLLAAD